MARRKKRRTRRKFTGLNVLNALETYMLTNVLTETAFKTNPIEFFTGFVNGQYKPGADGSAVITLPELLGAGPGGVGGQFTGTAGRYDNLSNAITTNVGGIEGLFMASLKMAGVGVGFKIARKMTRRARSMLNRDIIKPMGLGDMVKA